MRAREFVIRISVNGDKEPEISVNNSNLNDIEDKEEKQNVFVPPLQQQIELQKAAMGKSSDVIDSLLDDDDDDDDDNVNNNL